MALLQRAIIKTWRNIIKLSTASIHNERYTEKVLKELQEKSGDMPIEIESPFVKDKPQCILCKFGIEPDFKNVRMLSQFVSKYTGRIYGRHITGLCENKQKKVEKEIKKAQTAGMMGTYVKNPNYLEDPDLYDPARPIRPHPH